MLSEVKKSVIQDSGLSHNSSAASRCAGLWIKNLNEYIYIYIGYN